MSIKLSFAADLLLTDNHLKDKRISHLILCILILCIIQQKAKFTRSYNQLSRRKQHAQFSPRSVSSAKPP